MDGEMNRWMDSWMEMILIIDREWGEERRGEEGFKEEIINTGQWMGDAHGKSKSRWPTVRLIAPIDGSLVSMYVIPYHFWFPLTRSWLLYYLLNPGWLCEFFWPTECDRRAQFYQMRPYETCLYIDNSQTCGKFKAKWRELPIDLQLTADIWQSQGNPETHDQYQMPTALTHWFF